MSPAGAERAEVAIVGAGIVGLATALRLLERVPESRVVVLEKEATVAAHQSGHNSGVLHAGLYYAPGSLKATLCREGKAELEAYCQAHDVPIERTGKLVIARDESELGRFEALKARALANEVPGLEEVGPERLRELEPHAVGLKALWSPGTGVVDFTAVARALAHDVVERGALIETRREVTSIERRGRELVLGTSRGDMVARHVIACAGLHADRVAAMSGDATPLRWANVDARLYGLDVDGGYDFDGPLRLDGVFSFVRGERRDIDDRLYRVAPPNLTVGLTWEAEAWTATFETRAVAEQKDVSRTNSEQSTTGYVVLSAYGAWEVQQGVSLSAGIENLLDHRYRDHLSGYNRNGFGDVPIGERLPGPGRGVFLRLSLSR